MSAYEESLRYLYGLQRFGVRLGLEPMRQLLTHLGNPHESLRFIHVAGTNGKGSVCAMLASIFRAANYRTGLYTSPHLVSFCERIQINGQQIPEAEVARLTEKLRTASEQVEKESGTHPTFFEFVTAMAAEYFREQKADIVIWETGLGGRLDATNVVTPLVSVITNIALDHTEHLGKTLEEIAREKCGIIKSAVPVVTGAEEKDLATIVEHCARVNALLFAVSKNTDGFEIHEFHRWRQNESFLRRLGCDATESLVEWGTGTPTEARPFRFTEARPLQGEFPLGGEHQLLNALIALVAAEKGAETLPLTPAQMRDGLAATQWPARFQYIEASKTHPALLLDGAHNPAATETLAVSLQKHFAGRPLIFILGILRDKDYVSICQMLAPLATEIYCVGVKSPRAASSAEIAKACSRETLSRPSMTAANEIRSYNVTDAGDFATAAEIAKACSRETLSRPSITAANEIRGYNVTDTGDLAAAAEIAKACSRETLSRPSITAANEIRSYNVTDAGDLAAAAEIAKACSRETLSRPSMTAANEIRSYNVTDAGDLAAAAEIAKACSRETLSRPSMTAPNEIRSYNVTDAGDFATAWDLCRENVSRLQNPVVIITGSLFLCGEALAHLKIPVFGKVATGEFTPTAQ